MARLAMLIPRIGGLTDSFFADLAGRGVLLFQVGSAFLCFCGDRNRGRVLSYFNSSKTTCTFCSSLTGFGVA